MSTIYGVITDRSHADMAVDELRQNGFDNERISLIAKDLVIDSTTETGVVQNVVETAASGATTGGVVGGIAGLAIAAGAITVPGIGALLVGGPLVAALGITGTAATAVSAAATGALAGGLLGALVGLGLPEETARIYSERINEGAILISVQTGVEDEQMVSDVLVKHGASDVYKAA